MRACTLHLICYDGIGINVEKKNDKNLTSHPTTAIVQPT